MEELLSERTTGFEPATPTLAKAIKHVPRRPGLAYPIRFPCS